MIVKKLIDYLQTNNKRLFNFENDILKSLNYDELSEVIDCNELSKYETLMLLYDDIDEEVYNTIQLRLKALFIQNEYKYKKLKQTIDYEYDYSNNYDVTIEVERDNVVASREERNRYGRQNNTTVSGARNDEIVTKIASYDSDELETSDSVSNNRDGVTDTTTRDAFEDIRHVDGYTDFVREFRTERGDKSVRSVASIIKEERTIAMFSIYDEIYKDAIELLCLKIFS